MTRQMLHASVPDELAGKRLDQVLAELFPDYSRSRLQKWVKSGKVTVNGTSRAVKEKVTAGDLIELQVGEASEPAAYFEKSSRNENGSPARERVHERNTKSVESGVKPPHSKWSGIERDKTKS